MTGIICVNKDKDITSFGVCAKLRGITREKKVGHTGTLDPMATGVLPIMLGGATRFLNFLPESDKGYRASFILGKTTDTLDVTGSVTSTHIVEATENDVINALDNFRGEISQLPPMYSAVSVDGKRLYELARQGIEVERSERKIEIKSLELVDHIGDEYIIDVLCTKGTYIRTLIDDLGRQLGCGAVMTSLERTRAMGFELKDSVTLSQLQERKDNGLGFDDVLFDLEKILEPYDKITVTEAQAKRFSNGGALDAGRLKKKLTGDLYRVYSPEKKLLGLGQLDADKGELAVKRLLVRND